MLFVNIGIDKRKINKNNPFFVIIKQNKDVKIKNKARILSDNSTFMHLWKNKRMRYR